MGKLDKIFNLIDNFKKAISDSGIDAMMTDILSRPEVRDYIVSLNHLQLKQGTDSEGTELSRYRPYSQSYARYKGSNTVDLYVTGKFYDTFRLNVINDGFEIVADTKIYGKDFKDIYGKNIIGLSVESLEDLRNYLKPIIFSYIKQKITNDL